MTVRSFSGTLIVAICRHALVAADEAPPRRLSEVAISVTSLFFFANAFSPNAGMGVSRFRSRESRSSRIGATKQFSDSDLVQKCLKGDEAAWAALIGKYKNLIFSIPMRYGFSEEDSADIFQAVCIDLLTELPRLREPNALAGWLIQVARNKCFHRKQSQQNQRSEARLQEDVREEVQERVQGKVQEINHPHFHASPEEPERLLEQLEQERVLREAMLVLSPRCRQLVHMLFFEMPARPYEQVAKELDLAIGSIGFIRRRCLDKLRLRLEQSGFYLS
jgi:RNA polymerase sigma factor (sigma-70 family)